MNGLFEFKERIKDILEWNIGEEVKDFERGMSLLEELLYINAVGNGFNREFGEYLNTISAHNWEESKGLRVVDFFEKLNRLVPDETISWENMKAIPDNARYDVVIKYCEASLQYGFVQDVSKKMLFESAFFVYIEYCLKYETFIEKAFKDEAFSTGIDFVRFASEIESGDKAFYEEKFVDLKWLNDDNNPIQLDANECVKFIGEPGIGKTTQMRKLYWDEVKAVQNEGKQVVPIWIDLKDVTKISEKSLEEAIKSLLGKYAEYYEVLLKSSRISLYLDGYNEIIISDADTRAFKVELSNYVDKLHEMYPNTRICMTDRNRASVPPCLEKNITVCHFEGMNDEDMERYIRNYAEGEACQKVLEYLLESDDSDWLEHEVMIPEKMNMLIELVADGVSPTDKNSFYERYLDAIIERERGKKETRLKTLGRVLHTLAKELPDAEEEMGEWDILDLWAGILQEDKPEALLDLAIDMHILVPGRSGEKYKFKYRQYWHHYK